MLSNPAVHVKCVQQILNFRYERVRVFFEDLVVLFFFGVHIAIGP